MKKPLSTRKRIALFSGFLIIVTFLLFIECNLKFPKDITLFKGENLLISSSSPYSLYTPASFGGVLSESGETFEKTSSADKKYVKANDVGEYSASVRLFGVIPIKNVTINVSDTKTLIPCGDTIGIKMFTEGLLCVGVSDIADKNGKIYNIASENDIKPGDIFISANDTALTTTEQFADIVTNSDGNQISLLIERNKKRFKKEISPRLTSDGYKIGIWVRDSTAGIGTLSFVDPITGDYGALGHPICDSDTGILMPVSSGSIVKADVFGVQKGEKGVPGELKGTFDMSLGDIGTIEKNTSCGIYGKINSPNLTLSEAVIPIASKGAVKKGAAQIISNINGKDKEVFDIEIERISSLGNNDNKSMVIQIKDESLLRNTGGIVQGMSGSPIIQNGRIVGAVTHVFVNDPTRGYGIFIENMLAETG